MGQLEQKIKNKTAYVAIIGQGYVGLPLALLINKAGFFVWGIDKDKAKIKKLKSKKSYIDDISDDKIAGAIKTKKFKPTTSFTVLKQADVIIITVPTPLDVYKIPDLTYIKDATREIAKRLRKNQRASLAGKLIILESTTYPGTTEEVVLPILKNSTFHLAFSPERVDPGNKKYNIKNTPKVIGGVTKKCTQMANLFYSQVIDQTVPVSNAKTAEMTKLLENIFRIVNISMINEMALLCGKMGIDIWEVIGAAKTKPYGFMPFYPGPGVVGHCIAVDPLSLSYKAKKYGFFTRFIDLAGQINELMPHYIVTTVGTALNYSQAKSIKNAKILLLGVSYKKDIKDTRESAALKIAEILHRKGAKLSYFDPYIPKLQVANPKLQTNSKFKIPKIQSLTKTVIKNFDAVLILTDHSSESIGINYNQIAKWAKVVVDTRDAVKSRRFKNVYQL